MIWTNLSTLLILWFCCIERIQESMIIQNYLSSVLVSQVHIISLCSSHLCCCILLKHIFKIVLIFFKDNCVTPWMFLLDCRWGCQMWPWQQRCYLYSLFPQIKDLKIQEYCFQVQLSSELVPHALCNEVVGFKRSGEKGNVKVHNKRNGMIKRLPFPSCHERFPSSDRCNGVARRSYQ